MPFAVWLPGPLFLLGVCAPGPMFLPVGSLFRGSLSRDLCSRGLCSGSLWAGGSHPTGMLSCINYIHFSVPLGLIFQYVPMVFSMESQYDSDNAMRKKMKRMEHIDCFEK